MNGPSAENSLPRDVVRAKRYAFPGTTLGCGPNTAAYTIALLSTRTMYPSDAPHSFAAFSTTASSTGCRFVGEPLITRRISLVAVCCSKASVSALFAFLEFLETAVRSQLR